MLFATENNMQFFADVSVKICNFLWPSYPAPRNECGMQSLA